jgi:hypothetical protein
MSEYDDEIRTLRKKQSRLVFELADNQRALSRALGRRIEAYKRSNNELLGE